MSEVNLKKKYLKRAHHLIQGDGRLNTKRSGKLQASVEPLGGGKERRVKYATEKLHGSESCSDCDSLSLASHRSSSSQLASFDPPNTPPLEMKPMLSPSSRFSSVFQHSYPRTSFSAPVLQQNCKRSVPSSQQRTTIDSSELESQLRIQTDVNKELKRLLVASVGSDLENRLQQIVQEKAELSQDLDASLQQVVSNHEELDQVLIECDIWRSKFIASRVMIDELASWKAELSLQLRESLKALQYMLHERGDICKEVIECSTHLQRTLSELERLTHLSHSHYMMGNSVKVAAVSPVQKARSLGENHSNSTVLDLAHRNTLTARELSHRVTAGEVEGGTQSRPAPVGLTPVLPCRLEPTAGERLAQRVMNYRVDSQRGRELSPTLPKLLLTDEDLVHRRSTTASVGSSLPPLSRKLFHFGAKALEDPYDIHFHCSKCRGKIIIV